MADYDVLLRGGTVVDGTGAPAERRDLAVRDGQIVDVGPAGSLRGDASRVLDIDGLVVTPGFVDLHTHYDAQLLWDPTAGPSPLHGVTSVFAGNCGFSVAPLAPDDDYVMRMMARVEGMPLSALRAGPAWSWSSFGDYLDRLEGRVLVNTGVLVGHSTVRRAVMGDDAVGGTATSEQVDQMVALVRDALASGAIGFSSSLGEAHTDGEGHPVPSRSASHDEILAMCRAVRDYPGTTVEFIAAMGEIPQDRIELMTEMSLAAQRPLNWNLLGSLSPTTIYPQQLTSCDHARARGAKVVALTLPDVMRMRANRVIDDLPGWRDVVALNAEQRRIAITDPATRAALFEGANEAARRGLGAMARFELLELAQGPADRPELAGRSIADIATALGVHPIDVLIDVVLPERLPLTMVFPSLVPEQGLSDAAWRERAKVWLDERTVLGGSDAGAHVDLMCHANYPTVVLGEMVRDRGLLSIEAAVRQLTDVPARLYGLRRRGRIAAGWHADLAVFDPATIGTGPTEPRFDLPGGEERLVADAVGVSHVFVNGTEIVRNGEYRGDLPGIVLRSGRDTDTAPLD